MTTIKKTDLPNSSDDPATAYAQAVVDGSRVAGPHVRDQCARHLKDLKEGHKRGLVWDVESANRAMRFFSSVLKLNGGNFEGVAFQLLPWQQFVVGSIFGWKGADGYRRFRVVYVETAKGSGKSPLAAGIGMVGLVADGENRAEIYAAATKKDQAMILFRDAVAMYDQSPELSKRLSKSGTGEKAWNLAYLNTGSFFRPISSDDGQSGPRPHIALVDEYHEHKTATVLDMMRAGTKSRRQALIFIITNAGSGRNTPCWSQHEYGVKVASGELVNDAVFPYICALDDSRDICTGSFEEAIRYILRLSCHVQTTQIEKLHQADFAPHATKRNAETGSLTQESDALITLIEQSIHEAFAKAAITLSDAQKTLSTSANGTSLNPSGLKKTEKKSRQQEQSGGTATEPNTLNGEGFKNTDWTSSDTSYCFSARGAVAQFVAGSKTLYELITAIKVELCEDCSVKPAILESVCWETTKILLGALSPTSAALASAKISEKKFKVSLPADDPFESEDCWPKANPSLQDADLPGYKYIREQVTEAKGMPSKEAIVRRLNFCQWTDAESPWISYEVWKGAEQSYDIEELRGRRAVAGLDLSSTTDLTGMVFLVAPISPGETWKLVPYAWLPDVDLQRKADTDRVPYVQWKAEGLLSTTPGRAISKRIILQKLSAMSEFFDVVACAYDRWRIEDLISMAADDGISLPPMIPFGQGYKDMSPALEEFERMLLNNEISHPGHKILTMCAGNAVTDQDGAGNRKLDKEKATGRIDLMIASVMAVGVINSVKEDEGDDGFYSNPIMVGV